MRATFFLAGMAGLLGLQATAMAADPYGALTPAPVAQPRLFELRAGAYIHDPASPEKGSADLNGELLVDPWKRDRSTLWGALVPRLHVGGTASLGGKTSQAYAGFTWTYDILPSVFIEGALGGALHNGKSSILGPAGFNAMGCNWGFHEQASLGYRLTDQWSVMMTVEHTSNAGLCSQNRGLTDVGLRLGYSF